MEDIFVARHPIYNNQLEIVGYELLYREDASDAAVFTDGSRASSQLIINTYLELGLENIVGSNPAFINLTHDFFVEEQPVPMQQEQVVLEVQGETLPESKVLTGLQQLARDGYAIALDDFVYRPELEPLLKLATFVKIDLAMHDAGQLREQVARCRNYPVKLMAETIETASDLALCRELGFDYFQGFFLSRPQTIAGRGARSNLRVILRLLAKLDEPGVDMGEIAQVLIEDPALAYKFLRYCDCATYALRREIASVHEALALLGRATLKKWAILLLMASEHTVARGSVTSAISLQRACQCQLLANAGKTAPPEQAFTVGLFSLLESSMQRPMVELLDTVSLTLPIKFALLDREGELGRILGQVLSGETGNGPACGNGALPSAGTATA